MFLFICSSSSEDECTIVDDDDDTMSNSRDAKWNNSTVGNAKRSRVEVSNRNTQSSYGVGRSGRTMGVSFGSDDSSEEDALDRSVPSRKRRN